MHMPATVSPQEWEAAREALLVQEKAMSDLVESEVPRQIVLNAPVVTKDNVDQSLPTAFES